MAYPKRSVWSMFWSSSGGLVVALLLFGMLFAVVGVSMRSWGDSLRTHGVEAPAEVIDMTRAGSVNHRTYSVTYRFTTPDGVVHDARQMLSFGQYNDLALGDVRPVRYLPEDPDQSELAQGRAGRTGWMILLFAAACLGGGAAGGWIWWGRARTEVALRDHGEVRRAEVIRHQVTGKAKGKPGSGPGFGIAHWRDETGVKGKTLTARLDDLPQIGQTITIYADPTAVATAVWEGDVGTR